MMCLSTVSSRNAVAGTAVTASTTPFGRLAIMQPAAMAALTPMSGMADPGSASQGRTPWLPRKDATTAPSTAESSPPGCALPLTWTPSTAITNTHVARAGHALVRRASLSKGFPQRRIGVWLLSRRPRATPGREA